MHTKTAHGELQETYLMIDKNSTEEDEEEENVRENEQTAIFFVNNLKMV